MIFRPELAALVASGAKTETRRPVKGDALCRYVVGKDYAVQPGRGQRAIARILVTDVRREALGDLDTVCARREGFTDEWEFFDYWRLLYGTVDYHMPVWAIGFHLVREPARAA